MNEKTVKSHPDTNQSSFAASATESVAALADGATAGRWAMANLIADLPAFALTESASGGTFPPAEGQERQGERHTVGDEEVFETLLERPGLRLERIVSRGQVTPPGQWYDQEQEEWVAVIAGCAHLRIEGHGALLVLKPGDSVYLPPHCRHRVEWTATDEVTVWLALHSWLSTHT